VLLLLIRNRKLVNWRLYECIRASEAFVVRKACWLVMLDCSSGGCVVTTTNSYYYTIMHYNNSEQPATHQQAGS
jgi:membrane-bound lytic murein transglycosylase B